MVDGKPVFYLNWQHNSIENIYDILSHRGEILNRNELQTKFKFCIDIMQYNSLMSAIPKEWLHTTHSKPMHVFKRHEGIEVKINKILKGIKVNCKDFYSELINKKYTMPKCVEKWDLGKYFYVNFDWQQIYSISFAVARETALQSVKYMIINKYFPCNI